ncbi:glycosyltransferase [Neobittarella massiliensis]|uniref:glycosyltransferase n=1 Tax=Neobittarella massiliensis (ex Bilen et al. 2018) TaxID=2041842 RepID=UPI000CF6FBDE|nr:glycosyltransferase [Neobittarella massiliensis]
MNYSVLMSVYKREKAAFLQASIQSMMAQTALTDDFVLVCDGPLTDELDAVINQFVNQYPAIFHIVRLPTNQGLGNALNKGMAQCRNELIARMDSDDISMPHRCARQLKLFEEDPTLDIVSASLYEFEKEISDIRAMKTVPEKNVDIYQYARRRCPFNHPVVMYKKSAVLAAGGYQDFPLFEDYYLWVRMLQNHVHAYNIPEPLLYMRAGTDMYNRRGGLSYLKKMKDFRRYMLQIGFSKKNDYLIAIIGQTMICILPNTVRSYLYKKLLRDT